MFLDALWTRESLDSLLGVRTNCGFTQSYCSGCLLKLFLEPPLNLWRVFNSRLAARHAHSSAVFLFFTWTLHLAGPQERQRCSNKEPVSVTALFSLDDNWPQFSPAHPQEENNTASSALVKDVQRLPKASRRRLSVTGMPTRCRARRRTRLLPASSVPTEMVTALLARSRASVWRWRRRRLNCASAAARCRRGGLAVKVVKTPTAFARRACVQAAARKPYALNHFDRQSSSAWKSPGPADLIKMRFCSDFVYEV